MICSLGEAYGYHVFAILWLLSQYEDLFALFFDVTCKLRPFILTRLLLWATNQTLINAFGYVGEWVYKLRKTTFGLDDLGELQQRHRQQCGNAGGGGARLNQRWRLPRLRRLIMREPNAR